MLRSKVIVASQNNSAVKTSGGHLGSTCAQSSCLMSVPSVNPVSFLQDSQLCGSDRWRSVVFFPIFFLFFFFGRYFSNRKFLQIISDNNDNLTLFVLEENMGD